MTSHWGICGKGIERTPKYTTWSSEFSIGWPSWSTAWSRFHVAQKILIPPSPTLSLAWAYPGTCRCENEHGEMLDGRSRWPGLVWLISRRRMSLLKISVVLLTDRDRCGRAHVLVWMVVDHLLQGLRLDFALIQQDVIVCGPGSSLNGGVRA